MDTLTTGSSGGSSPQPHVGRAGVDDRPLGWGRHSTKASLEAAQVSHVPFIKKTCANVLLAICSFVLLWSQSKGPRTRRMFILVQIVKVFCRGSPWSCLFFLRWEARGTGGQCIDSVDKQFRKETLSIVAAAPFSAVGETEWDHTVSRISAYRALVLRFSAGTAGTFC